MGGLAVGTSTPSFASRGDVTEVEYPGAIRVIPAEPGAKPGASPRGRLRFVGRVCILGNLARRLRGNGLPPTEAYEQDRADRAQHRREQQVEADSEDLGRRIDTHPLEEEP